ncbi:hypothetical protein EVAR_20017_1 [Eumeta japonica]|uniref:Uncharacterized protein n=1 Tax=Eumeta variegata TaxID=151549 RepID=A0A4C1VB49_EUMVA|nr:hypothetical protein EVAR_20017_1 [Eumeta japonica]
MDTRNPRGLITIKVVLMVLPTNVTMTEISDRNKVEHFFRALPVVLAMEHAQKCYISMQSQRVELAGYC